MPGPGNFEKEISKNGFGDNLKLIQERMKRLWNGEKCALLICSSFRN